ncbi:MAG: protein-L-isoaspartate(D-aspartate) O-methyltransferase [Dehalococcoidales bacterium]|nr:protein-L-isoaspartate(D-aspartate) O-methyltransferase [Dehalococcoidales bacterium]
MNFEADRARLIEHLSNHIGDERVLTAMSRVPREFFVPPGEQNLAYEDIPLPIGLGQTISQPFIIALMTASLQLTGKEKVLEVGTGSGYQTAILAELVQQVITVERLPELLEAARKRLDNLGYSNVTFHHAGPTLGWPGEAPYDDILVTAGAPRVPDSLVSQLAVGGRLVIPVGSRYEQELYKVTRGQESNTIHSLGGCRFVSLIGGDAWEEE